jgi:predicted PurR-regulated permease PerM
VRASKEFENLTGACPLSLEPYQSNAAEERSKQLSTVRGYILFAFAVALALALAWRLRAVLELVYVSALFAVVLMPLVQNIMRLRIRKWSPSRPLAIVALVLSVFLALTLFLIFALPPVLHDIQHFAADLPHRIPPVVARIKRLPFADKFGFDSLAQKSEGAIASTAQYLLATAPLWLSRIFDLFTAFILCIYFMLEGEFVYFYFLSFFSTESRDRLAKTLVVAEVRMSSWFIGQTALMLILGLCSTITFAALHVRYFFLLGVLMGLFNIIPVVGGIITIVLAACIAATDSWTKMAGVLIFYAIYVQIENAFLTPRIMRSRVKLMGLSVLVALLAGTALAGVVGALVAIPTAALIAVIIDEYFIQKDAAEAAQTAAQAATLAYNNAVAAAAAEAAIQATTQTSDPSAPETPTEPTDKAST